MLEREREAYEKSMPPEVAAKRVAAHRSDARPRTPSDADVSVAPFDSMNVSVVRFQGKGGSTRRTSTRAAVRNVLTEAAVSDDGTPPVEIDAGMLLDDVVRVLDSSMAGCTAAFAAFYQKFTTSEEAIKLLVDSFWYVSVCLFDQTHTKAAAALLKRLSRTYSVFMYGMPPGREKDVFMQYFPYIIVQGIERAYRLYFPSSGSLYTPAFFDRVHALVSTLFVHDTGGGHGRGLRAALREKLFNPKNGRGPRPPPMPDLGDSAHRLATDWSDIVCDENSGQYHIVAKRGGGPAAVSPTVPGGLHSSIRAGTAPAHATRSHRSSAGSRNRSSKRGGGTAPGDIGGGSSYGSGERVQWHFPGADELVQDPSRPNSAEFELSNYNGQTQRSPLVGSYLRGVETPESSSVPQQFVIKRTQDLEAEKEGSKPVFKSTLLASTTGANDAGSRPSNGHTLRFGSATQDTKDRAKVAKARKEQSDAHVLALAEALGLGKEARATLGAGEQSEKSYKHVRHLHAEAIQKERRAKRILQRQAERQSHSIVLGGRKKVKEFCYDLTVQREKEKEMSRIEGKQKGGRDHLGRRSEAQLELEKLIGETIVHPADKQTGKHTVTNVFEAAKELGTTTGRKHERAEEMARLRGVPSENMLYDPTRFKSTAVRQAALEAGGGALPPRTRPPSMRELRRTPSKEFRIAHTRSMDTLPYFSKGKDDENKTAEGVWHEQ